LRKKDKSLPLANEYADNKFVDAEANYRVSNSKIQIEHLQLRKRYLQAEPSF
jgi:hypothetical protein